MEELASSWFCTRRGNEAMECGSVNEHTVTSALRGMSSAVHLLDVAMMERLEEIY